ncbi:MAG: sodium:solute symporter family protein [Ruminococcaceae bacterium]|nr:sodium:solute symporter family protein [Oscillospiraceae bacterium]MBQ9913774.1 sodium:solute symporter family protein [Clostridia bacterium]
MDNRLIIWLTIAVYILFIGTVSVLSAKKSKSIADFTVGGRNAGAWLSAFSYGTAYFSAVMFIGYAGGTGWKYGLWGILPGIGNAVFGSFFAWLVLAKRTRSLTRKHHIKSMPQFFEKRFGSKHMKTFCTAVIFLFLIPYSASVYKGLTSVCSVLLGVEEKICMIVISVAAVIIVIAGGYAAAIKADFIQGIVMLVGVVLLIIAVMRSQTVGGFSEGLSAIAEKTEALGLGFSDHAGLWATVLMTSFGTWGLPQMIHKYYGIRDDKEVKRGTVISTFFALVVAGGGYFIGTLSRLFFSSLDEIPGTGAGKTDYLIPNMLSMSNISQVLIGVILVLLIAASVSTLSSITITASTTFTMDFIKEKLYKTDDKERLALVSRAVCLVFVVLSYFIANGNTPILDMMSYSWGIISGSFLAPYLISLYSKRLNSKGAWAGMLSGFFTALPPVVCKLFFPDVALPVFGAVKDMGAHFACLAMAISFIFCLGVSAATGKNGYVNEEFYETEAKIVI